MRRLFIAFDLSIPVVERLVMLQHQLRERVVNEFGDHVRLRLVDAENIHITLKFLGDTTPEMVPLIREQLQAFCESLFPFEIECHSVGAFPDLNTPRVIWAGLEPEGAEVLELLQRTVEQELGELGVPKEHRPFHPHVTLARVKSRRTPSFQKLLYRYDDVRFGRSYIRDLALFESHLREDGPSYEVVERFPLG